MPESVWEFKNNERSSKVHIWVKIAIRVVFCKWNLRYNIYRTLEAIPLTTKWRHNPFYLIVESGNNFMAIHTRMTVVLSVTQAIAGTSNVVSSNYWVYTLLIFLGQICPSGERCNEVNPMWSTNPWNKARPLHRELRALLFTTSAWVL